MFRFYGWWLVGVCLLIQAVGFGTSLYLYSVLIGAIATEMPGSRTVMMLGVSGMLFMVGVVSPKVGAYLDRYPIKWVLMGGSTVLACGFLLMSLAPSLESVVALYATLIAAGMAILSPLSCSILLTRWFVRYRGLALGISALGTQFGGVVFPPTIAAGVSAFGWRPTVLLLAAFVFVAVPALVQLFVVEHPKDKGQYADGDAEKSGADAPKQTPVERLNWRDLLRNPNFTVVVIVITVASITYSGVLSSMALIAQDKSFSMALGASLVSMLSVAGIISSPLLGRVSDLLSVQGTLRLTCAFAFAAMLLFRLADNQYGLYAAAVLFGFFGGAVVPIWSASLSRAFASEHFGQVLGFSTALVYGCAAFSGPIVGALYDASGSYASVFLVLAGLIALSSLSTIRLSGAHSANKM